MNNPPIQQYSLRRLSPFRGMLQVIEFQEGNAVSTDGHHWRIQPKMPGREYMDEQETGNRLVVYGIWSTENGLQPVEINPMIDIAALQKEASPIIDYFEQNEVNPPFPSTDRLEYWLLDQNMLPLVLLSSTNRRMNVRPNHRPAWESCIRDEHPFISARLEKMGIPNRSKRSPSHHRDLLMAFIHHAAGHELRAQWFLRDDDGTGHGITGYNLPNEAERRNLESIHFPRYMIKTDWHDLEEQELVMDYIDWLSPLLLTYPKFTHEERSYLEKCAVHHPLEVARHYSLYPEIVNKDLMTKILAEAKMREPES